MNRKLNMDIINKKESKIVTTKEALKDVIPFIDTEEIKKDTVEDFCKGFEEFLDDKIKNKFKNKQEIKGVVDMEKSLEQQAKELREKIENELFNKYARKEYSLDKLEDILNKENNDEEIKIDFYNCDFFKENTKIINKFGFRFEFEFNLTEIYDTNANELEDLDELGDVIYSGDLEMGLTKAYINCIRAV